MRDIGVDVNKPEGEWDGSKNCPFYGTLRLRGQIITGVVSSEGMQDTVVVERQTTRYMTVSYTHLTLPTIYSV